MKRIIFILAALSLASCSVPSYVTTTYYADISLYDGGKLVGQWPNATLQKTEGYSYAEGYVAGPAIRNNGLDFKDENGAYHYIQGGAIIAENIRYEQKKTDASSSYTSAQTVEINKLVDEYKRISAQVKANKDKIKEAIKDSEEYKVITHQSEALTARMKEIKEKLWNDYRYVNL